MLLRAWILRREVRQLSEPPVMGQRVAAVLRDEPDDPSKGSRPLHRPAVLLPRSFAQLERDLFEGALPTTLGEDDRQHSGVNLLSGIVVPFLLRNQRSIDGIQRQREH